MKEKIKDVLAWAKTGTLSVVDFESGAPFGALVNVATDAQYLPIFMFSTLARHTKCLLADPRASLMVMELPEEGDPLTGFRATITGALERAEQELQPRYIAHHPYAELYAGFGDFGFWRMKPEKVYVVAGFGKIQSFEWGEVVG
jgi:heme iron utilization protein